MKNKYNQALDFFKNRKLNKAKNINDIHKALEHFDGPAQNFAYATKHGDIGLTIAGKFPIKWEKQGKFSFHS